MHHISIYQIVARADLDQPAYEDAMLSDADLERYARQVIMPHIGEDGQERLLAAKVLMVGAGGLGAPVILYLAAADLALLYVVWKLAIPLFLLVLVQIQFYVH